MKKYFILFNAVCMFGLQCGCASADEALSQRIEAAVPASFSGQIVIGNTETILYSGSFGFADREAKQLVTDKTLFDIGSITKTYTATAVLLLAAQDKIRLDMTLSDWFDELPDITGSITLHQLSSHTSGLPQYSGDDDEPCNRECFDLWLTKASLEFSPGQSFSYSNPGYSALARIIEKISGQSYETFVDESLVGPLGAGPVGYLQHADSAEYAVGYLGNQRIGAPPDLGWMDDGPSWHLRGNGGLLSSATALYRWLQATATGATLPNAWQSKQFERHAERNEGVWYGYGWSVLEKPWGEVIDHTGGNGFFFADARWFRDKGLLLTITNNAFDRDQIQSLLNDIRAALELAE
jgi:CubicO group peptidase (beta-lactamase class C family)